MRTNRVAWYALKLRTRQVLVLPAGARVLHMGGPGRGDLGIYVLYDADQERHELRHFLVVGVHEDFRAERVTFLGVLQRAFGRGEEAYVFEEHLS